jgi:cell division protein FtsL
MHSKNFEKRLGRKYNGEVRRERDWRLWWQCVGALAIGLLLVGGFSAAAQQHFSAHRQSIENVVLERERDKLRDEQKRLILEREAALSLEELKKKARLLGMQEIRARQIDKGDLQNFCPKSATQQKTKKQ